MTTACPLSLRPATAADAPLIAAMHAASWQATYRDLLPATFLQSEVGDERAAYWRARMEAPGGERRLVLIAQRDDTHEPVGFVCVEKQPDSPWGVLLAAFVLLGAGIGAAETVSNELVISTAPAAKAGAASAVSETAYELGAVLGTAILGTIITASYRAALVVPDGLSAGQADAAGETLGGAVTVADTLPGPLAEQLLASARSAFDSGVGVTAVIGIGLVATAAIVALVTLRHVRS